jgi:hypothetical protein
MLKIVLTIQNMAEMVINQLNFSTNPIKSDNQNYWLTGTNPIAIVFTTQ